MNAASDYYKEMAEPDLTKFMHKNISSKYTMKLEIKTFIYFTK
jgi:hypothetical protein